MSLELLKCFFGWCSIINIGLLLWWFLVIILAHDFIYRMHTKWFKISAEKFDAIHYNGIIIFKLFVMIFNVIPYFALLIISK